MLKKDLKSGMIAELRNGMCCLVIRDCETHFFGVGAMFDIQKNEFMPLESYKEDLTAFHYMFDVVKVYGAENEKNVLNFNELKKRPLVWERDTNVKDDECVKEYKLYKKSLWERDTNVVKDECEEEYNEEYYEE